MSEAYRAGDQADTAWRNEIYSRHLSWVMWFPRSQQILLLFWICNHELGLDQMSPVLLRWDSWCRHHIKDNLISLRITRSDYGWHLSVYQTCWISDKNAHEFCYRSNTAKQSKDGNLVFMYKWLEKRGQSKEIMVSVPNNWFGTYL